MADPGLALHKALLSSLQSACSCSVYDSVPDNATYPYAVIDSDQTGNTDLLNLRKDDRFIYISIWSRARGSREVRDIIAEIQTINEVPLSIDTGDAVSVRVERTHTNREPDALTFMGHVTLRVITTH